MQVAPCTFIITEQYMIDCQCKIFCCLPKYFDLVSRFSPFYPALWYIGLCNIDLIIPPRRLPALLFFITADYFKSFPNDVLMSNAPPKTPTYTNTNTLSKWDSPNFLSLIITLKNYEIYEIIIKCQKHTNLVEIIHLKNGDKRLQTNDSLNFF